MQTNNYFQYGEKEKDYLKKVDPILGKAIDEIGDIQRAVNPNLFTALINTIVGQQISTKAQTTVWKRMLEKFQPFNADTLEQASISSLQECGISFRKAEYIKEISKTIKEGKLDLLKLQSLSDEEVCEELSQLKGIGKWTAEMLMIFSMQRIDILSYGDLAILRGMRMLYHHRKITPKLFQKYKRRYSPYASVVSLYLWAIAGGACPEMKDYGLGKKTSNK